MTSEANKFWTRLDSLRIRKGISMKTLAESSGIDPSYLYVLRHRGSIPNAIYANKIAYTLGVSSEYLMDTVNNETSYSEEEEKKVIESFRSDTTVRSGIQIFMNLSQSQQSTIVNVMKEFKA